MDEITKEFDNIQNSLTRICVLASDKFYKQDADEVRSLQDKLHAFKRRILILTKAVAV